MEDGTKTAGQAAWWRAGGSENTRRTTGKAGEDHTESESETKTGTQGPEDRVSLDAESVVPRPWTCRNHERYIYFCCL